MTFKHLVPHTAFSPALNIWCFLAKLFSATQVEIIQWSSSTCNYNDSKTITWPPTNYFASSRQLENKHLNTFVSLRIIVQALTNKTVLVAG